MIQSGWLSKSTYLEDVTGNEIVEEQERINASEHMKVIATTILPSKKNEGNLFHAWIYYNVKSEALKSMEEKAPLNLKL